MSDVDKQRQAIDHLGRRAGLAPEVSQLLAAIAHPYDADASPSSGLKDAAQQSRQFVREALTGLISARADASARFGGSLEHLCLSRAHAILEIAQRTEDASSVARIERAIRICEGYEALLSEKPVFNNYLENVPAPVLIKQGRPAVGFWR